VQFTSLNRILSALIVGSIFLTWLVWRHGTLFVSMPTNTVQWGISFVALALMCGVVVDALTEILVNDRMVKRARTRKRIAEFFLQGEMYDRFHR
jgi:TRAP-type C4-dicarboxylate transport system permease small subunit